MSSEVLFLSRALWRVSRSCEPELLAGTASRLPRSYRQVIFRVCGASFMKPACLQSKPRWFLPRALAAQTLPPTLQRAPASASDSPCCWRQQQAGDLHKTLQVLPGLLQRESAAHVIAQQILLIPSGFTISHSVWLIDVWCLVYVCFLLRAFYNNISRDCPSIKIHLDRYLFYSYILLNKHKVIINILYFEDHLHALINYAIYMQRVMYLSICAM